MMIIFYIQLCVLQRDFIFIQDHLKTSSIYVVSATSFNYSLIPILKGTTQQVTLILIFFLYTVWPPPLAGPNTHTPLNILLETSIFRSCMLLPHIRLILTLAHLRSIFKLKLYINICLYERYRCLQIYQLLVKANKII